MKKALSVALSLILLLSVFVPFYTYANVHYSYDNANLLQEGDFDIYFEDEGYAEVSDNAQLASDAFINSITNGLKSVSATISNLYTYRVTADSFKVVYSNIINDNPELFYVSSSYSYSYRTSNGVNYVSSVTPQYSLSAAQISSQKAVFDKEVSKALSLVDDSMTDVQKTLVLHDYLCSIARYPKNIGSTNDKPSYHSAFGIFNDGDTVCAGYTLAYSYLLHQLDIPSYYVSSSAMSHAWNAIYVDNNWYYVDLTFDDIGYYGDCNTFDAMHHRCFLKSKESLSSDMGFYHYDYVEPSEVDCSSTKYDDYFWNDVDTNIYVIDGYYYYPSYNMSTRYASIVKRDTVGNESTVCDYSVRFTYNTMTSNCSDENNVNHSVQFYDKFLRILYLDNRFYVTSMNNLYSITFDGKLYNLYTNGTLTSSNLLIGIDSVNGDVSTQTYSSNGSFVQHSRKKYFDEYFSTGGVYHNYADKDNNGYINAIDYVLIRDC